MPSYNYMKAADRDRARADGSAELAATQNGSWPRDINDQMRWINLPAAPYDAPAEARKVQCAYVAGCLRRELSYLDELERRIASGDPDLAGYEA